MRYNIIFFLLLYLLVSTVGVGWLINRSEKKHHQQLDMALGGRSLGTWAIGSTMVLIMLGSGHIQGTFEGAYSVGVGQLWYVMAHGFLLVIVALTTGMWARRMRITSVGDMYTKLYNEKLRIMMSAINIVVSWVIMSCEIQAMAICVNVITGLDLNVSVYVSALVGFLYVIIGGMNQNAKLNQLNIVLMYGGLILVVAFIGKTMPGGNYGSIREFFVANGKESMLSFTGPKGYMLQTAIPSMMTPILAFLTGQSMLQTCAAAKSEKALRRTALFMAPLNAICGCLSMVLALSALTMSDYAKQSAKTFVFSMLIDRLPTWLITIFLGAVVLALLSSISANVIGSSTILTNDYVKNLLKPNLTTKQSNTYIRVFSLIGMVISTVLAQFLPPLITLFVWLYSFLVPSAFLIIFGLWWKRNNKVALVSCLLSWGFACIWTFTPLRYALGMENVHQFYIVTIFSLVILVVGNLIFPGKPGYFRSDEWKKSKEYQLYQQELREEQSSEKTVKRQVV